MSRASSTVAISIATSLVTSSLMFLGLQFWLVPHLKREPKKPKKVVVEVPKVIGLRPDDAKIILKQKGLLLTVIKQSPHATIKAGLIHAQNPLPSSVLRKGETVRVETSSGIPKIAVPLVVGKPVILGRSELKQKGLNTAVTYRVDSAAKPGQILSQTPAPGREVMKATVVNLVVAKASGLVEIPSWKKMRIHSRKAFAETLKGLHLELGKVRYTDSSDRPNGWIYKSTPKSGEKVKPGTKVDFLVQRADDDD